MNGFEQLLRLDSSAVIVITDPDAPDKNVLSSQFLAGVVIATITVVVDIVVVMAVTLNHSRYMYRLATTQCIFYYQAALQYYVRRTDGVA